MPLSSLQNPVIAGRIRGAYREEGQFVIESLEGTYGLEEILQYLFDNQGSGGGGGQTIRVYDAGLGFWVKGTLGITVTSSATGIYNINIPTNGILESFGKQFTNAGTEYTGGGSVQINIDWNTSSFNTNAANAILPLFSFIDAGNNQRSTTELIVTAQHTGVSAGTTSTTLANLNGSGTPLSIKAIL